MAKKTYPLSRVYQLLEPGPVGRYDQAAVQNVVITVPGKSRYVSHREPCKDVAIQRLVLYQNTGLPHFARNDNPRVQASAFMQPAYL